MNEKKSKEIVSTESFVNKQVQAYIVISFLVILPILSWRGFVYDNMLAAIGSLTGAIIVVFLIQVIGTRNAGKGAILLTTYLCIFAIALTFDGYKGGITVMWFALVPPITFLALPQKPAVTISIIIYLFLIYSLLLSNLVSEEKFSMDFRY